jgi:hypothetical protein
MGHYPSNNVDPWCLITKYLDDTIRFLGGFAKATQYPSTCQKIYYGTQCIFGILERGNACSLSISCHKKYPFDSLVLNNLAHGFY